MANEIAESLQENLLVVLSFDKGNSILIRNAVDPGLFTGFYREIASRIYTYIDRYKVPPESHIADILEDKINSENTREADIYGGLIESIYDMKEEINTEYIMNQLEGFVRRQSLRSITVEAAKCLLKDTDESLEEAESLFLKARERSLKLFNPGLRLTDSRALNFLNNPTQAFPTGIPELDKRGFGPTRKELYLYLAKYKSGKSWWLTHLGKIALMSRLKVVHISLEMSEERCAQRYFQTFFAIAKRAGRYEHLKFNTDKKGVMQSFEEVSVKPKITLDNPDAELLLQEKIALFANRALSRIVIKEFPTGRLTIRQLEAYLDNLESTEKFIPDLVIIDYPDLMQMDTSILRLSIDEVYKQVRGMGVERNMAMAIVSQTNQTSERVKTIGGSGAAEHYGKVFHADCAISHNQTEKEHALGLARLHVAAGRNDEDKFSILISQDYNIGQFVIDSALMDKSYWKEIEDDIEKSGEDFS